MSLQYYFYVKEAVISVTPCSQWPILSREYGRILHSFQNEQPFGEWVNKVRDANSVLKSKPDIHLDADRLRPHIRLHIDPELDAEYRLVNGESPGKLDSIADIEDWISSVSRIDQGLKAKALRDRKAYIAQLAALGSEAKKLGRDYRAPNSSNAPSANAANASASSTSQSNSQPFTRKFANKLSFEERELLKKNDGCTGCRKPFVGSKHVCEYDNKPLPFGLVPIITQEYIDKCRASTKTTQVAAVFGEVEEESSDDEEYNHVDEYVLPAHLTWNCLLSAPSIAPTPVTALIDHGAPPAMISSELASRLSLPTRPLRKPLRVSGAFSKSQTDAPLRSSPEIVLSSFVVASVVSPCAQWHSKSQVLIVCPNLRSDIILGLDFLARNDIVVAAKERTAIDRKTGFDLLNPPDPKLQRKPPKTSPFERRKAEAKAIKEGQNKARELRKKVHFELEAKFLREKERFDMAGNTTEDTEDHIIYLIKSRIASLADIDFAREFDRKLKTEFDDCFPSDIPHVRDLPNDVYHRIEVNPNAKISVARAYSCPRKYRDGWKTLIDQHLAAGRIRPSNSPYTSPSFIIPKADKSVLPRWVNDYRALNSQTVPDSYPLPRVEDILADCAKGKIWGKIDMTNSFFQTLVHPDDIKYTATLTPFGLWEWVVMPMGLRNSPATHQRRVTLALKDLIGNICHVYLDDIVIWSNSVEEHEQNVRRVLEALRKARLFCSMKKSTLFTTELDFLGHHISSRGIEPDSDKVERITNWPVPQRAKHVRQFLGLVRYISAFLPALAEHTSVLTPMTRKECNSDFPPWTAEHQHAFESIKRLVLSSECLTTIDHVNPGDNKIFLTCDASKRRTGAVLSFGKTWESARPVAFDSRQYTGAERNYPTHEQELLAILRGLRKWRNDLLGSHIHIYTDHKTLQNFDTQRDLSSRQARWMEYMSQYDYKIHYIRGEDNTVADAMSRLPSSYVEPDTTPPSAISAIYDLSDNSHLLRDIKLGYDADPYTKRILEDDNAGLLSSGFDVRSGLIYVGDRLVIPKYKDLRENLFRMAHDNLGHFGGDKSYAALRASYYWPNMRRDLISAYIPSCRECQRNKTKNSKPPGPLRPLPTPDNRFSSITIDFIGPLPVDGGFDQICTMTCRAGAEIRISPCHTTQTAEDFAAIFFRDWYCENGLPDNIISDRDTLFMSRFWQALLRLAGVKHKRSSSFHPQTDGLSEQTNKTVIQCLRFHVDRNQEGWVRCLPLIRFHLMNTVNASTGFAPFQLRTGFLPKMLPSLSPVPLADESEETARRVLDAIHFDFLEAMDNLVAAKMIQAHHANAGRAPEIEYQVGQKVMLSTVNRRREYIQKRDGRVAKFMPRFDGPYRVISAHPETSSYTLELPEGLNICPTFHSALLQPYHENDNELFPSRELAMPPPILTDEGVEEYFVEKIVDERNWGRGKRYLVRWKGYGPEYDLWRPGKEMEDTAALDVWEAQRRSGTTG
ncbi:putative retrotransposable element tf2 155 kda protein type 1-like [Lyophyllum shimeji]|uniref:RNA-directed DNA polymerase n=1 Tax=Lyophyllum shimeji TaxID=47721 RepID=A0A9P3PZU2_LYOSH|nr:putative retrotransposable element tf2 155 kda protein type 1-like [Lyophyllum shimeji]